MAKLGRSNNDDPPSKPTMMYVCASQISKTLPSLLQDLSKTFFVRTNSNKSWVSDTMAVIHSKMFVFILENEILEDSYCLTLLGIAVAYDIPIIAIREIGYALPNNLPKEFVKTEIIDWSQALNLHTRPENLTTVTTLEKALRTLYSESIAYHEIIHNKCVKEIYKMIHNLTEPHIKKSEGRTTDREELVQNLVNEKSLKIQPWPPSSNDKKSMQQNQKNFKQDRLSTSLNGHKFKKIKEKTDSTEIKKTVKFNGRTQAHSAKSKADKRMPKVSITKPTIKADNQHKANEDDKNNAKPRSQTTNGTHHPQKHRTLRRQSSLPNIVTNYLVANPGKQSPTVYHYPSSPRLYVKKLSLLTSRLSLLEDEQLIHISRTCSPDNFSNNEEDLDSYLNDIKIPPS